MTLSNRLDRLEAISPPNDCTTCQTWTHRVTNDEADDSPYELERRRGEPPGPRDWPATCPDCGREIPTIRIVHVDGDLWRNLQA